MKCKFIPFFLLVAGSLAAQINYSNYVDPMIGTGGHGHTFPGATVPFGMVQLSPDTRIDGSWDGCSGYHFSDSIVYGFSHTHLSGTGCSDYGDILLFPSANPVTPTELLDKKISSTFNHKNEKASAGYYSVLLDNGVKAELTSTTRVGMHRYTFPEGEFAYIVLDLVLRDKLINASASLVSDTKVKGYRQSEAWARNQTVMYVMEFSEPLLDGFTSQESIKGMKEPVSGNVRICYKFKMPKDRTVLVKVALSPVTVEGCEKNMIAELPHWNFDQVRKEAEQSWNKELSKIEVVSDNKDQLKIFYTALYHTMIQPNVAMDVDSMYRGPDMKSHKAKGYTHYTVFSLWDTFRATHPLYTLIDQKRTSDYINTFLSHYEQSGRLPVWELASNETDCMIGYHSVSVIADAMLKGINGFDYEKAYAASKRSAMFDHLGLSAYKNNGFISMDDEHESVSKTLEYAYDDWCIARMAKFLNKKDDYTYFIRRSNSWKNVFDQETGFMRPKKNGAWITPFDPREVNNNFTEGNSWQYSFFVPHDIPGLIQMMGGKMKFEQKLDQLFTENNTTTGREQVDITGLIGQYAHGNEPSHHMSYLYDFVGKPSKTQVRVQEILNGHYTTKPDGLIGNEDCGQMSAWYVLSSLGFYPVTPGSLEFMAGSPSFVSAKINFENGKNLMINAPALSKGNCYVQELVVNGLKYSPTLFNGILSAGGSMDFVMGKEPKDSWTGGSASIEIG
ncbi:MAG: GH92 family glycosyl hydrolase, partial [Bacteroidota bacterium]|nr:GH92 family glycosyl hydrolase [Bacteroidota bacterium]